MENPPNVLKVKLENMIIILKVVKFILVDLIHLIISKFQLILIILLLLA